MKESSSCTYRDKKQIRDQKAVKGGRSASTWFLKGQNKCTLKVAATPGSVLINKIKGALKEVTGPDKNV